MLALSACGDTKDLTPIADSGTEPDVVPLPPEETSCVAEIEPSSSGGVTMVELCALDGGVRHVVVEGARAPRHHASYQVFIGLDAPIGSQDEVPEGGFKLMNYGGGTPAPSPSITPYLGAASVGFPEVDASFVNVESTYCFDIHDGSATTPAYFVLWLEGTNGADCADRETLTMDSAIAREIEWIGAIDKSKRSYFYQSAGIEAAPIVTLYEEPALSEAEILAWEAPVALGPTCTTEITPNADDVTSVELCQVEDGVRHVVVEGLSAPRDHTAYMILFGLEAAIGTSDDVPEGAFKLQGYGGGQPFPSPALSAQVGEASANLEGLDAAFLTAGTTYCFDIHDGSATTPAYFVLWLQGENGADCGDRSTLTMDSAAAREIEWTGGVDKSKKGFFYLSKFVVGSPVITLSNEAALTEDAITSWVDPATLTSCTTELVASGVYQPICQPAAGAARHFRVENAGMNADNRYLYLVLHDDVEDHEASTATPAAPAADDGRFVLTLGKSQSSAIASYTYFRFNGGNSNSVGEWYEEDSEIAKLWYTAEGFSGPNTACFDLEQEGADLRFVLWIDGVSGADCFDRATLTLGRAVYDSTTAGHAFWQDAAISGTGFNFLKASGAAAPFAAAERVVAFSEPARH